MRPELPLQLFSLRCPTENELKRSVQRKRNGAAPGLNALTYVPYKKCASIMKFVHKLGIKIWKSKDIPTDWAMAYVVLLSKSNDLSLVSEYQLPSPVFVEKYFFQFSQKDFKSLCSEIITSLKIFRKVFFQECLVALSIRLDYLKLYVMQKRKLQTNCIMLVRFSKCIWKRTP